MENDIQNEDFDPDLKEMKVLHSEQWNICLKKQNCMCGYYRLSRPPAVF
jgi:hypothetical protein